MSLPAEPSAATSVVLSVNAKLCCPAGAGWLTSAAWVADPGIRLGRKQPTKRRDLSALSRGTPDLTGVIQAAVKMAGHVSRCPVWLHVMRYFRGNGKAG